MTNWIEINMPWEYEPDRTSYLDLAKEVCKLFTLERERRWKPPIQPTLAEYREFNNWFNTLPISIEINKIGKEIEDEIRHKSFLHHPANKAGVLIEVRNKDGFTTTMLIGDMVADGSSYGEDGAYTKLFVIKYLDLAEIIDSYRTTP